MTTLGKILVFINLVFSVLVGGLVVVVFMARTNFADALEKLKVQRSLDQGIAKSKQDEAVRIEAEYRKDLGGIQASLSKTQKDLAQQLSINQNLNARLAGDTNDRDQGEKIKATAQIEIQRAQADVLAIGKRLQDASAQNTQLVKEVNKITQEKFSAEIERKVVGDRNDGLEAQLRVMATEYAKVKSGGTGGVTALNNSKNPPSEKIDGQVTQATETLVKISIGSDSGLKTGHTLELFRLGNKPAYLGTVRITSLESKAAVATPVSKLNGVPQVGDNVSSRLQ